MRILLLLSKPEMSFFKGISSLKGGWVNDGVVDREIVTSILVAKYQSSTEGGYGSRVDG